MRKAVRRKDREITEIERMEDILRRGQTVCVAFGGGAPYVIPMSYGIVREEGHFTLYMHGAGAGEKIERVTADSRAAFTVYTDNKIYGSGDKACSYSATFDSVCGSGTIRMPEEPAEKRAGLEAIMAHYAPGRVFSFEEKAIGATCVLALDVETLTGKHHE